jgi:hypothetical protein
VMIEAVENHMPEVIVIDEIGTELEAMAARTIAERGVQLVGTAHGNTLENLMMNPTLADLIGGIQSVTLGDEEARRRHTQKSILERKSPPTFDIVVEIQERDRVAIHPDVGEAVDALLRDTPPSTEIRWLDENSEVRIEKTRSAKAPEIKSKKTAKETKVIKLYLFGVNRSRVLQIGHEMHINVDIVDNLRDATILVTSKNYYRRRPQKVRDAESEHIPVYVLRGNSPPQIRQFLGTLYATKEGEKPGDFQSALAEAEEAAEQVGEGGEAIELSPQGSYIRRLQHLIAQRNDLKSNSTGRDPNRRVKIFKERQR